MGSSRKDDPSWKCLLMTTTVRPNNVVKTATKNNIFEDFSLNILLFILQNEE